MTFTTKITAILITLFCKETDELDELSLSGAGNIQSLFQVFDQGSKTQRATIDVANFTFTSQQNVELSADPDAFVFQGGTPVTGMVDLEFIELFTKADILKYGIQTLTYNREILESDGEFKIEITQDGEKVRLKDGKFMNIKVPDSTVNDSMQLFRTAEFSWQETNDSISTQLDSYYGQLSHLNWVNIDYYSKFDFDYTTVQVELPDSTYERANTRVFALFHDQNTVIALDYFSTPVMLPIGERITIVALSAQDTDSYLYDELSIIIEANHPNVMLSPQPATPDEISDALDRLGN